MCNLLVVRGMPGMEDVGHGGCRAWGMPGMGGAGHGTADVGHGTADVGHGGRGYRAWRVPGMEDVDAGQGRGADWTFRAGPSG